MCENCIRKENLKFDIKHKKLIDLISSLSKRIDRMEVEKKELAIDVVDYIGRTGLYRDSDDKWRFPDIEGVFNTEEDIVNYVIELNIKLLEDYDL